MGRNRQSAQPSSSKLSNSSRSYSAPPPAIKNTYIHNTPSPTSMPMSSGVGSSFIGSMTGSLAGSYLGNKLFNNHNSTPAQEQSAPVQAPRQSDVYYNAKKCLENNPFDYNQCKTYIDEMMNVKF